MPWQRFTLFLATFGGIGYLPGMPGTWGSLAALPLWWAMQRCLSPWRYALAWLALLAVSLWAAGEAWNTLGEADHPAIVLDEVMGLLVALAWVPPKWPWVVLGFALFCGAVTAWAVHAYQRRVSTRKSGPALSAAGGRSQ